MCLSKSQDDDSTTTRPQNSDDDSSPRNPRNPELSYMPLNYVSWPYEHLIIGDFGVWMIVKRSQVNYLGHEPLKVYSKIRISSFVPPSKIFVWRAYNSHTVMFPLWVVKGYMQAVFTVRLQRSRFVSRTHTTHKMIACRSVFRSSNLTRVTR